MTVTHSYHASLVWSGSTGAGYRVYDRTHRVAMPPAVAELELSADPSFGGEDRQPNPEQLLLAAASSCQLLSFLALAARAGIDVVHYADDAEAMMPSARDGMRITAIVLRPQIVVADGTGIDDVRDLVHTAHESCYIANSLTADVTVDPFIEHASQESTHTLSGADSGTEQAP